MTTDLVAALDIGGTKIAGALVDAHGVPHHGVRRPTDAPDVRESVMERVREVVAELRSDASWQHVTAVGIGSAGPLNASRGTVSPVNIPGWRDFPLVDQVRQQVGALPVTLVGDGAAMVAAEHAWGAARGYDNALGMVVSTGVGGGLVLGGRLLSGPSGNAGHVGHISVELAGQRCACGGLGCVEQIASGPSIVRHAQAGGWRARGPKSDAATVAAAAREGDVAARAAFERAARALAASIAATAALVEIEVAVVGGGVAQAEELLFTPLRAALGDYATLSFTRDVLVVPGRIGRDAGLLGAAAACRAEHAPARARYA